jgi:hypothetical protein
MELKHFARICEMIAVYAVQVIYINVDVASACVTSVTSLYQTRLRLRLHTGHCWSCWLSWERLGRRRSVAVRVIVRYSGSIAE